MKKTAPIETDRRRCKFKAVNTRDKNFTRAKMDRRLAQLEESVLAFSITFNRRMVRLSSKTLRQRGHLATTAQCQRRPEQVQHVADLFDRLVGAREQTLIEHLVSAQISPPPMSVQGSM
jgi:hypothetical protein